MLKTAALEVRSRIQQRIIPQTRGIALAKLGNIDDPQGGYASIDILKTSSAEEENILGNVALSPPAEEENILANVSAP